MTQESLASQHLDALKALVGEGGYLLPGQEGLEGYLTEWRGLYQGQTPIILRPNCTAQVAAIVKYAGAHGLKLVPQGGNTGLVGGGMPTPAGDEILISLNRMKAVREIDALNDTMTVEAGVILQTVQEQAAAVDRLFPLSLAAEGSCTIGGNLSSNAGGVHVLRYGNTRDLVLGLEVVLPSGEVWEGLTGLRKDNTGYDLKHLFIGAEGTLGIITAATLKLFPRPTDESVAFIAVESPAKAVELLAQAKKVAGQAVTAFELVPRFGLEMVCDHMEGTDPLAESYPWYVLCELTGPGDVGGLDRVMEAFLEQAFEAELVLDAVPAASKAQAQALWQLRESLSEAQKFLGGSIKHDIAVPVSKIPEFLSRADAAVTQACPGIRPCPFGHVGDGNLHYNLTQPEGMDKQAFLDLWEQMNRLVHDIVVDLGGSISAEHGIGRLKKDELAHYANPVKISVMNQLKAALDPAGIMNPGRIL